MSPECNPNRVHLQGPNRRQITAQFNGGSIVSDAGVLLLTEADRGSRLMERWAECFVDHRDSRYVRHPLLSLLRQRVFGLALGYEDLNDHDELRQDPLLGALLGRAEQPLAGKSTLNRLELTTDGRDLYKKITVDPEAVRRFWVDLYVATHPEAPAQLILDLDATDDPLHGRQEGAFFHGYYGNYCYLPLYIFTEDGFPLCARLRTSNRDASSGAVEEVETIVALLRESWPETRIVLRADSGFAREELMAWCEKHGVDYVFGLARNSRLVAELAPLLEQAACEYACTQSPVRYFADFEYQTRDSWSRPRRVIGKAEHLAKGSNPRFIVTSLGPESAPRLLYERLYCARGEMENRIKEQQLDLFADRTSCNRMAANQLRLWFSTTAYLLLHLVRVWGLVGTALARAQCQTIRLKLLKIGAHVRITTRRIWVSLSSAYPHPELFVHVCRQLARAGP
jgi:hypothetical protein